MERLYLGLVGKSAISLCFGVAFPYSADLFPTNCRSLGIGMCSQAARVGAMTAPLVLHVFASPQPVFGFVCLVAGAGVMLFLPDTRGLKMPETLDEFAFAAKSGGFGSRGAAAGGGGLQRVQSAGEWVRY